MFELNAQNTGSAISFKDRESAETFAKRDKKDSLDMRGDVVKASVVVKVT